ncbi:MAG: carboxypeptidase-like regulatory domain-containing protein [Planctomycetota bacterium]
MPFLATLLFLTAQQLEAVPARGEIGEPMVVIVRAANGEPVVGVPVQVRGPDGNVVAIGASDATGGVEFVPDAVGTYELRARLEPSAGAVILIHAVAVEAAPQRWVYVLLCMPAGVVLLWHLVRPGRRRAARPPEAL